MKDHPFPTTVPTRKDESKPEPKAAETPEAFQPSLITWQKTLQLNLTSTQNGLRILEEECK